MRKGDEQFQRNPRPQRRDGRPERQDQGAAMLSPQQIRELVNRPELRIADYPHVLAAAQQLMAAPEDPHLQALFRGQLDTLASAASLAGDPFYPNYPPAGQVLCGPAAICIGLLATGVALGLAALDLLLNLLVVGRTGSAKTTWVEHLALPLVRAGFCVVVLDRKRRWRRLLARASGPGEVVVLGVDDLDIALSQPPPGVDPRRWVNELTRVVAQSYGRYSAQRLLEDMLQQDLAGSNGRHWPSLAWMIHRIETFKPGRGQREASYKESLLWTLKDLRAHLAAAFDCSASDMLEKLFSRPGLFVVETEGLPTAPLQFLTAYLQQWAITWHLATRGSQPVVFILEDATSMADRQRDRETPGGVSLLGETMYLSRELGVGTIPVVHTLRSLSSTVVKNAGSLIVCALQGDDVRLAGDLLGTTREQSEALRILQPGQAVASMPTIWPHPLPFTFPDLQLAAPSEAPCRRSAEAFCRDVTAAPARAPSHKTTANSSKGHGAPRDGQGTARGTKDPSQSGGAGQLDDAELRVLIEAARRVPPPLTEIYRRCGLSRKDGRAAVKGLCGAGLAREHRFSTGRRGGRLALLELAEAGWRAATQRGAKRPQRLTRGGWAHDVVAGALASIGRQAGWRVRCEQAIGSARLDVVWQANDGRQVAYQIGLSDPQREAEALERIAAATDPGRLRLVAVVADKGFVGRLVSALNREDPSGGLASRVETRLAGSVLACLFKPGGKRPEQGSNS